MRILKPGWRRRAKRQIAVGGSSSSSGSRSGSGVDAQPQPADEQAFDVVTVTSLINGQLATGVRTVPVRSPAVPSPSSDISTASISTPSPSPSPSSSSSVPTSSSDSSAPDLDEDETPTPISDESASATSTESDTDSSSSTSSGSSSKVRPEKTATKSESSRTKSLTSASTPISDKKEKDAKDDHDEGGGLPVTTYVGIALGCVGFLLLIMAATAYYRRWRRRREVARQSFTSGPMEISAPVVPPSPTETTVSEKEHPSTPDWNDAPAVPAMPAAYQQVHSRASSLPTPGSDPESAHPSHRSHAPSHSLPHSGRSSRRESRRTSRSTGLAPAPRRSLLAPLSIDMSGDSRLFSRPVSEVVLEGRRPESHFSQASSAFSDARPAKGQAARHNSYASSQHESLMLPSARNTMKPDNHRLSNNYI